MSVDTTASADQGYDESNMKTLKDAAHIRQNPGMYVGNTSTAGLHHLVYEIVYNSVDEALAGYCSKITVTIHVDGSISIGDDGRGIPVGVKAETGKSTLEEALTIAGTSGKFDNAAYRVSAGLHGMGAKAMNALSEWCKAEVRRDGRIYQMEFERGVATSSLKNIGPAKEGVTGTIITFKPDSDPDLFGDLTFSYDILADRFREIAYLNRGLHIALNDERDNKSEDFHYEGGIAEYVTYLNSGEKELVPEPPVYIRKEVAHQGSLNIVVEIALQYTRREDKIERCYTNNAYNPDGGTHLSGYRAGLTRALTTYGRKENHFKDGIELKGEDFRDGLTIVVSLGHPDPLFESQTKVKLNNPEVEGVVSSVLYEALSEYLEKNPKTGEHMCKYVLLAAESRIAAKKARDALKDRKSILSGGGLPGKLMDCTSRERDQSELFLVEGDSAGGSAESGRDRMYQAVLPLRGKVLNVEKAREEKLLANAEIAALIAAIGIDINNTEDIERLRYGKIVILTDADVDGQHIRTLLLTFFFRQMRKLVETGHIFVARPPLFKVTQKKEVRFVQTREAMAGELFARGLKGTTLNLLAVESRTAPIFPKAITGETLSQVIDILEEAETSIQILERRGQPFVSFCEHVKDGALPVHSLRTERGTQFLHTLEDLDEAVRPNADEWHEVVTLNRALKQLQPIGIELSDLIPLPRLAGREPPVRFVLENGDHRKELDDLRALIGEIRKLGEKGLTITRFKGLGEMDPEELWDTTLDPQQRTMLRVSMEDALRAEKMFRTLMGDDVEGRRDFILKHRANLEDIDYGA